MVVGQMVESGYQLVGFGRKACQSLAKAKPGKGDRGTAAGIRVALCSKAALAGGRYPRRVV